MSLLTLVNLTSATFALLAGAAVLALSAAPRPAWVAACGLACVVMLGTSATALAVRSWAPVPSSYGSTEILGSFDASRNPVRERTDVPRPASVGACLRVL